MSDLINQYGLSRYIPASIKRQVRINSGFGCVICGLGIIDYDHVDPEFKDAHSHDPNCITLLCLSCHNKKTRGFLFTDQIKAAMKTPKALQSGFTKEYLYFRNEYPNIIMGGMYFSKCHSPIEISNQQIVQIKKPETKGAPYRLSAIFFDTKGKVSFRITDNEWQAYTSNWDIEVGSGQIKLKNATNLTHLILKNVDSRTIKIEKLVCKVGDKLLLVLNNYLRLVDTKTGNSMIEFIDCSFHNVDGFCLSL